MYPVYPHPVLSNFQGVAGLWLEATNHATVMHRHHGDQTGRSAREAVRLKGILIRSFIKL